LKWISASEGAAFAEEIRLFVQLLNEIGENPLSRNRILNTGYNLDV
jgi:coenzyme F420-reducing hydrogenase delta subunit